MMTQKRLLIQFKYGGIEHKVTIQAFGESQNLKGLKTGDQRPDLILMDDVFANKELLESRERKIRAKRWVLSDIDPLGDEGQIINIGTIGAYDDPQLELAEGGGWRVLRYAACSYKDSHHIPMPSNPEAPAKDWDFSNDPGVMLWDRYDKTWLYKKYLYYKGQKSIRDFFMNYMSVVQDDKMAAFPRLDEDGNERLIYYYQEPKTLVIERNLSVYLAVDPASSKKASSDRRVCMIVGVDQKTDIWYVLDFYAGWAAENEFIQIIIDKVKEWNPIGLGVEKHGAQIYFANNLENKARENYVYKEWQDLKPGNQSDAKHVRIVDVLSGRYMNGRLLFRKKQDTVLNEMWTFVKYIDSGRDDCLDALAYMGQLVPPRKFMTMRPFVRTCTATLPPRA